MRKYFYPDGKTLFDSKDAFVDFYSNIYYWKNSKFVEDEMTKIFEKQDSLNVGDIFDILAWKTGKIKHHKSEIEKQIMYSKGWDKEKLTTLLYNYSFDIANITDKIQEIGKGCRDIQTYMNAFVKSDTHIGPVYAVTLMSFNTQGKELIYDRFAHYALKKIVKEFREYEEPSYGNMPKIYGEYKEVIVQEFEDYVKDKDILKIRKLDQALWAYGHCLFIEK